MCWSCLSVDFFDNVGVDDPVGAISVHGVNGLWGVISVGIFATGKYGAGWNGVVRDEWVKRPAPTASVASSTATPASFGLSCSTRPWWLVFGFAMAYVWFKISNLITPIRVPREVEIEGLDMPEMGAHGLSGLCHGSGSASDDLTSMLTDVDENLDR